MIEPVSILDVIAHPQYKRILKELQAAHEKYNARIDELKAKVERLEGQLAELKKHQQGWVSSNAYVRLKNHANSLEEALRSALSRLDCWESPDSHAEWRAVLNPSSGEGAKFNADKQQILADGEVGS